MSRMTEWIEAETPPTISGVYERKLEEGRGPYSYYDVSIGKWHGWHMCISGALSNAADRYISSIQDVAWRGLAEEPQA